MTLIASTRVPDGIVIAADSMSTIHMQPPKLSAKGKTTCPNCGKEHEFSAAIEVPVGQGVSTTLPYSQKIQPLWHKLGVGTHGIGAIGNKSVFACIRCFENTTKEDGLRKTADKLARYLQNELKKAMGEKEFNKIPKDKYVMGFQIVGYEEGNPISISVDIGKRNLLKEWTGFGTTVSGTTYVAIKLWELKGLGPQLQQPYPAWSVQDAIDYCNFLIETTANYQRFANVIPSVGGEIDVGLVLPSNTFKWIKRKRLTSILLEEE